MPRGEEIADGRSVGWGHRVASRVDGVRVFRSRLAQVAVEILFVAGLLIFSHQLLVRLEASVIATWLSIDVLRVVYWFALGLLVLIPLFAVWRNLGALAATSRPKL